MDTRKFDTLTKSLATGTSRRSVIGGLFGGAFGITGLSRAAAGPAPKVDICHYDEDTGTYHLISVSGNALKAHEAHGDHLAVDGSCGTICAEINPDSSFNRTCYDIATNCTEEGLMLYANCQDALGYFLVDTEINVNSCEAENYEITNCNGILTCGMCPS